MIVYTLIKKDNSSPKDPDKNLVEFTLALPNLKMTQIGHFVLLRPESGTGSSFFNYMDTDKKGMLDIKTVSGLFNLWIQIRTK